jgi:hypothetical protein
MSGLRLATLLLSLSLVVACSGRGQARNPEGAVRLLIASAHAGDRAGAFRRLGPRTRARIEALHESTRRTGGRLVLKPEDFLSVGWARPDWEFTGLRTLRRDDTSAEVEVYSDNGDRHALQLVREGDEWKVELPGQ